MQCNTVRCKIRNAVKPLSEHSYDMCQSNPRGDFANECGSKDFGESHLGVEGKLAKVFICFVAGKLNWREEAAD